MATVVKAKKEDSLLDTLLETFMISMLLLVAAVLCIPLAVIISAFLIICAALGFALIAIGILLKWWKPIAVLLIVAVIVWGMSGCAAKKPAVVRIVVPKECITAYELTGPCELKANGGMSCPTRIQYACTKVISK